MKNTTYIFLLTTYIIIAFFSGGLSICAQEQGNHIIRNYTVKELKASMTNWAAIQGNNGIMYFGNEMGVLQYDGTNWNLIPTPQNSIVESLDIDKDGRIYVGSYEEFGYLDTDNTGKMKYVSLIDSLIKKKITNKTIWFTRVINNSIYFSADNILFRLKNGKIKTWETDTRFNDVMNYKNHVFIYEKSKGIREIVEDSLKNIPSGVFFSDKYFWSFTYLDTHKILIPTDKNGLYIFDFEAALSNTHQKIVKRFKTEIDSLFLKYRPYSLTTLKNGNIAVGIVNGGVVILDKQGKLLSHINKKSGLLSNSITYLYEDNENNLWTTTIEGISKTYINSPFTYWGKEHNLEGYISDIIRYNNNIYIGRYNGLFKIENNKIVKIAGVDSPVFSFLDFQDPENSEKHYLLAGTNLMDLIEIKKNKVYKVLPDLYGIYSICQSVKDPSILYLGHQYGISVARYKNNKWELLGKIKGINYRIRNIIEDKNGNLWLSNLKNELIHLVLSENHLEPSEIKTYSTGNQSHHIVQSTSLNNQLIFGNNKGLLTYDKSLDKLVYNDSLFKKIKSDSVNIIEITTRQDKFWAYYKKDTKSGIIIGDNKNKLKIIETPFNFLPEMRISKAYFDKDSTIWISGAEGLFRFSGKLNTQSPGFYTLIRQVIINRDSIIYYGNGSHFHNHANSSPVTLPYKYNSILFTYSAPSFYNETETKYKILLEGFDKKWADWTSQTIKEYTNLPEGNYTLRVKAKNVYDTISSEGTFSFTILPPWHRTIWAYIIYIVSLGLFIWLIVFLNAKRLRALNMELEETVKNRTKDLHEVNTELEEKQAELEVQQEEILAQRDAIENQNKELEKLSIVASETDNAITIMDKNGNFEWFNNAYIKMCGYSLKEFKKVKGENIIAVSDNNNIKQVINHCIKSKKTVHYESKIKTKAGKNIWTQVTITPILDENENIAKLISIESDIGRLKKYEKEILKKNTELEKHRTQLDKLVKERTAELEKAKEKAVESDRLKSAFLANMSHEIRTPMNAIIGFSDLIIDPELGQEQKDDLSKRITQNCDSLLRLIDDIIDISKIESNLLVIEKNNFKLLDILDELHVMYSDKKVNLNKNNIEIKINPDKTAKNITINTDKVRIKQVLINLMDNALKFTEQGFVELGYTLEEHGIKFYVKDTGIGLSREQQKTIFRRFTKIEDNRKKLYRGAGLGLSISKNIVELLGGKIWVESTLREGSTFYFTIPNN